MRKRLHAAVASLAVATGLGLAGDPATASTWAMPLHSGSRAEAKAQPVPAAPSGIAAACVSSSSQQVNVTWSSVAHATSYTVYDSVTSATTGFSVVATGVAGTTWTNATLSANKYWFEVLVVVGTNWKSANSTASSPRTTSSSAPNCS
jgi:hypothetical protein